MKKVSWIIALGLISLLSLLVGVEDLVFSDLFAPNDLQQTILYTLRIPRTISLVLAGATLAVSGLLMQQLTQNKFVSPTTAGTLSSARLGVIISMVFFSHSGIIQKTLFAFVFSVIGTLIFAAFLNTVKLKESIMVPLVGLMFGNIVGAIGTFFAYQNDLIQNAESWLQGNLSLVSSENYQLILLAFPLLILIYLFAHYFSVMNLGKEQVSGLGVSYQQIELLGIVCVSFATASVLLTVGNIPFIGIIIPNIVALRQGDHFKKVLFPTALFGSLFLVMCDIVARILIAPYEIPVSLIVGIIGTVIFLILLLKGEKR